MIGPMSDARFADGLRYRIEIPSVEGPRVLEAVLDEADREQFRSGGSRRAVE